MGMGPMTGRGMGTCASAAVPGPAYGAGLGFGGGRGCGRGFRRMAWAPGYGGGFGRGAGFAPAVPLDAKTVLADRAAFLEGELELIKKQLEALKED